MFSSSAIFTEDVVFILSKEALFSEESNFLEGFEDKKAAQSSALKCCSAIMAGSGGKDFLRLSGSSPQKLLKQINSNRLFIK